MGKPTEDVATPEPVEAEPSPTPELNNQIIPQEPEHLRKIVDALLAGGASLDRYLTAGYFPAVGMNSIPLERREDFFSRADAVDPHLRHLAVDMWSFHRVDIYEIFRKCSIQELIDSYVVYSIRKQLTINRSNPEAIPTGNIVITDLGGVPMWSAVRNMGSIRAFASAMGEIGETVFPANVKCGIIVNAPSWMAIVMEVLKLVISPASLAKVRVYYHPATQELSEIIDDETLKRLCGLRGVKFPFGTDSA